MGYDATSGEPNTTGQPRQTQALSFAGSTAKPHKTSIIEELTYISRMRTHAPHPGLNREIIAKRLSYRSGGLVAFRTAPRGSQSNSRMLRTLARGSCH